MTVIAINVLSLRREISRPWSRIDDWKIPQGPLLPIRKPFVDDHDAPVLSRRDIVWYLDG